MTAFPERFDAVVDHLTLAGRASSWANQRRPSSSTLTDTSVHRGRASKRIGERIRRAGTQGCRGVGSAALGSTRLRRQVGPPAAVAGGLLGVVGVDPNARDGRVPARQRSRRRRVVRLRRRVGSDGCWGYRRFRSFPIPLSALTLCVHWWSSLENCWRARAVSARSSMSASMSERAWSWWRRAKSRPWRVSIRASMPVRACTASI